MYRPKNVIEAIYKEPQIFVDELRSFLEEQIIKNQSNSVLKERENQAFEEIRILLDDAPNGMWTYLVSVYFMQYKDENNLLEEQAFYEFLNKITAFIWAYAFMRPGVNALRSPAYPEMIEIVNGRTVDFEEYRFDAAAVRNVVETYVFTNGRPITKSMLAWWAYNDESQQLMPLDVTLEIEHVFSRKRQENERSLTDKNNLESLGNKILLEKSINIRASDYRFSDKKKYYNGFTNDKGKYKEGTRNTELVMMAKQKDDFCEEDIVTRKKAIIDAFIGYLEQNMLTIG